MVWLYSLCTVNEDDRTFSSNILIPHGQSQSWYTYPVKERNFYPYIKLHEMIKRENQDSSYYSSKITK